MRLLSLQDPTLAAEEVWAHATPGPERGGLLLAAPDAPRILASERYWQVSRRAQGTQAAAAGRRRRGGSREACGAA